MRRKVSACSGVLTASKLPQVIGGWRPEFDHEVQRINGPCIWMSPWERGEWNRARLRSNQYKVLGRFTTTFHYQTSIFFLYFRQSNARPHLGSGIMAMLRSAIV